MKCSIPRCKDEAEELRAVRPNRRLHRLGLPPPELPLCRAHGARQRRDFWYHCGKLRRALGVFQTRTWQATWVQMVDLELLNSGHGIGTQRGVWKSVDGVDVWVPEGSEAPRPSAPGPHAQRAPPLPEHATRTGQAVIAKRQAEQELLERRLAAETADFLRGQRQVLELELKTKRETERREALKRAKKEKA